MYELLAIMFRPFLSNCQLLRNNCQSLALAFFSSEIITSGSYIIIRGSEIIASDSEIIARLWQLLENQCLQRRKGLQINAD
jgi:hypothetical protein